MKTVGRTIGRTVASPVVVDVNEGGTAAPWSPLQLTGLEYWFDSSDSGTITQAGDRVSQWNDKSGNNRHVSASGEERPFINLRTINGKPVLSDNASTHLSLASETPIIAQPLHYFLVCRAVVITGDSRIMNGMSNTNRVMIWARTNWDIFAGGVGAGIRPVTTDTVFVSALFAGAASKIWVNNNPPDTVDAGTNSLGGFRVNGQAASGLGGIAGDLAEEIVCSADNSAEMANVKSYLSNKWGLSL